MNDISESEEQIVLKPGETLVLRYKRISPAQAHAIKVRFEALYPDNQIIIVEADAVTTSNEGEDLASR
jgi:hypothetical protein